MTKESEFELCYGQSGEVVSVQRKKNDEENLRKDFYSITIQWGISLPYRIVTYYGLFSRVDERRGFGRFEAILDDVCKKTNAPRNAIAVLHFYLEEGVA